MILMDTILSNDVFFSGLLKHEEDTGYIYQIYAIFSTSSIQNKTENIYNFYIIYFKYLHSA